MTFPLKRISMYLQKTRAYPILLMIREGTLLMIKAYRIGGCWLSSIIEPRFRIMSNTDICVLCQATCIKSMRSECINNGNGGHNSNNWQRIYSFTEHSLKTKDEDWGFHRGRGTLKFCVRCTASCPCGNLPLYKKPFLLLLNEFFLQISHYLLIIWGIAIVMAYDLLCYPAWEWGLMSWGIMKGMRLKQNEDTGKEYGWS